MTILKRTDIFQSIFFFLVFISALTAQSADTLIASASVDTTAIDTMITEKKSELEGPVHYKADTIEFSIDRKITYLKGNSKIEYQNMALTASRITIDWSNSELTAVATIDSLDSLGNPVYMGIPEFTEKGEEPMNGIVMTYNFKTRRGRVKEGYTKMSPGYYKGDKIKKIGNKTILVKDGIFTSCENIHDPHYYFYSKKMWVKMNDKMAGKPVILYIADIPVFYLPTIFMSIKRERRSGIILPSFGESGFGGRYLKNFGFYWAINDYMDATLLSTYYEKRGFVYSGNFRYKLRYKLNGRINADYAPKDVITGEQRQRYRISFSHSHKVSETIDINASGSFQSDQRVNQDLYDNLDIILNQDLTTTVTMRKRFTGINSSLNLNLYRNENLVTGKIDQTLPRLSFSLRREFGKAGKSPFGVVSVNYSTSAEARYRKYLQSDSVFKEETTRRWDHIISITNSVKLFKYFNLLPNINFSELWVNEYRDYFLVDSSNTLDYVKRKGFRARHTFRTGVSLNTTMYGLFEVPFGPLKFIRHKLTPSVSFSYVPDFSTDFYGYVEQIKDTSGNVLKGDRFADFGATPTNKSQNIGISIRNFFQGKYFKDGEEKKIDLFNWNLNTSYNMLADSLKWSDINSSINTSVFKNVRLTGGMTHSLYETNTDGTGKRDKFYYEDNGLPLRFVRANASFGFTLNSDMFASEEEQTKEKKDKNEELEELETEKIQQVGGISYVVEENKLNQLKTTETKWTANFNFSYNYNKANINKPVKSFSLQSNVNFQLTKNWKINYNAGFDLEKKDINYQEFLIYRDLHCWEMSFTWRPTPYNFFSFKINVKSSVLKDLKLTKRSSGARVY